MKRLIDGIELIGRTRGDGFKKPFYLIRTPNKRYLQLSELLYQIVYAMTEEVTDEAVAKRVSTFQNKDIDTHTIRYLIEKNLEPMGLVTDTQVIFLKSKPQIPKAPDMLHLLRFRFTLLPARFVRNISFIFLPLFKKRVILSVLAAGLILNIWLFAFHGISAGLKQTLYEPNNFVLVFGLILASAFFHELGHATATRYGGAKPGRIGAGVYLIWPAFFTDISDVYRLGRIARLRSDFGGVYFNLVFSCVIGIAYFITRLEPLLLLILFQNLAILQQLIPFMRLDGYFIISDLVGIPDLFLRMKPILQNVFFRKQSAATKDLKLWVKLVVCLWIIIMVPLILIVISMLLMNTPSIFASAWNSASIQMQALTESIEQKDYIIILIRALQLVVFLFPALGAATLMYLLGKGIVLRINAKMDSYISSRTLQH